VTLPLISAKGVKNLSLPAAKAEIDGRVGNYVEGCAPKRFLCAISSSRLFRAANAVYEGLYLGGHLDRSAVISKRLV